MLESVDVKHQLSALEQRALDPRPVLQTPFPSMNSLLHRDGVHPGTLVVLGGRKGTRKTCVALSWAVHLLRAGVPVGILTLDESLAMYVSKLMSALTQTPSDYIENNWDSPEVLSLRETYAEQAAGLTMSSGERPNIQSLDRWLDEAEVESERPRVVFCDYTSLLVHYRGRENQRVPQLFEELQVWTRKNELVTVALHQAGRTDEGVSKKYHGDTPMTAEGLLYGGEQQADVIFLTYRPALNMLGNMTEEIAQMVLGDTFDQEKWADAVARVRKYKASTMLQLVKNRPSTRGEWFEGLELHSPNGSQYIEEKGEAVDDSGTWMEAEGY